MQRHPVGQLSHPQPPARSSNSCSAHNCAPVTPLCRSIHCECRWAVLIKTRKRCSTDNGVAGDWEFGEFPVVVDDLRGIDSGLLKKQLGKQK